MVNGIYGHGMNGINGMYGYGSIWMMVICIAFWVIFIGLIGLGIYLLTKLVNSSNKKTKETHYTSNYEKGALQTLQGRLVKGEIDEAEYERLKLIIERDKG